MKLIEFLGPTLLDKSVEHGIRSTRNVLQGIQLALLWINGSRCDAFVPLVRDFYLYALYDHLEVIDVSLSRSLSAFEANFASVGICWPGIPHERSEAVGRELVKLLQLKRTPCAVVVDVRSGEVITTKGLSGVIRAMESDEPQAAVKEVLEEWKAVSWGVRVNSAAAAAASAAPGAEPEPKKQGRVTGARRGTERRQEQEKGRGQSKARSRGLRAGMKKLRKFLMGL
ncbi:unnamed protein product [Chrysoparadoxa australica]